MFGQGTFRPMMGELRLNVPQAPAGLGQAPGAPAPSSPVQGPVSVAPAPVSAPAPVAVPAPAATSGMDHGTQVLVAGAVAGLAILGTIVLSK